MNSKAELDQRSLDLRQKMLDVLVAGKRGHFASALSVLESVRVLYDDILSYRPSEPDWPDRDRFILSKGHGCIALYLLLCEKGFFPQSEMDKFCHADGILGGHPEHKVPGVEASTGSLGHGLSIGVGMAMAAKMDKKKHRVIVLLGDGEINEGSVWEAALCASKHSLDNLTVMIDYNKQQSYDTTQAVADLEPLADKWTAFGFATHEVDGHDVAGIKNELTNLPFEQGKASLLICHTIKGRGFASVEGDLKWHHVNKFDAEQAEKLSAELGGKA